MDLRIEKTLAAIRNAFLQLRARKPLEKITVKELSALANINKATFYLHYHDIYDLSESLEREVVNECFKGVDDSSMMLNDVGQLLKCMEQNILMNEQLIKILFEGSRSTSFTEIFEKELYSRIFRSHPDYVPTEEGRMMMTFLIHGAYYTYFQNTEKGIQPVLALIEKLSGGLVKFD